MPGVCLGYQNEKTCRYGNEEIDPNLSELSYDKIITGMRKRSNHQVKDFMIPLEAAKATITYDAHITKGVYEMIDQNVSLLPVLKDDMIVGILRSVDVLHELLHIITEEE